MHYFKSTRTSELVTGTILSRLALSNCNRCPVTKRFFSCPCFNFGIMMQVLINAGQANAATGDKGYQDCLTSAKVVSEALDVPADDVLLLSTGVIGRPIKIDALKSSVPKLANRLGSSASDAHHAAVAITTTDLVSKSAALEVWRTCSEPSFATLQTNFLHFLIVLWKDIKMLEDSLHIPLHFVLWHSFREVMKICPRYQKKRSRYC